MTKLEEWIAQKKWQEWQKVLEIPIVQEALALLEDDARPNAAVNTALVKETDAASGAFRMAVCAATQAGIQAAIFRLRRLGRPMDKKVGEAPAEPYDHINEHNYQEYLQPR